MDMIIVQVLQLILWLFLIPTAIGSLFLGVDRRAKKLPFMWISGQILLWAVFQLICVPMVLLEKEFWYVVLLFSAAVAVLLVLAAVFYRKGKNKGRFVLHVVKGEPQEKKTVSIVWAVVWGLLLFQLVQAVRMTYADGDDAYYVAVSTITENADAMYSKLAYTGGATEMDVRHALAPFPVWIAFLSRVSHVRAVTTAHIAVPLALIPMTYAVFYLIGEKFFAKNRETLGVFLAAAELLVLFGDYSYYTAENFMIARSRQGKAALGSIMIPVLFLLLLLILERLQEAGEIPKSFWILFAAAMTAGCLCSTMGALLCCMLIGIAGLCGAVVYRNWKVLFPMAACSIPCVVFAFLYLLLG